MTALLADAALVEDVALAFFSTTDGRGPRLLGAGSQERHAARGGAALIELILTGRAQLTDRGDASVGGFSFSTASRGVVRAVGDSPGQPVLAKSWAKLSKKRGEVAVDRALGLVNPKFAEERLDAAGLLSSERGASMRLAESALPALRAQRADLDAFAADPAADPADLSPRARAVAALLAAAGATRYAAPELAGAGSAFDAAFAVERSGENGRVWTLVSDAIRRSNAGLAH